MGEGPFLRRHYLHPSKDAWRAANSALPQSDRPNSPCQRGRTASRRRDWKKLTMPDLMQQVGHSVFKRGCCGNGTGPFRPCSFSCAQSPLEKRTRPPRAPRSSNKAIYRRFFVFSVARLADFQNISLLDTLPFRNEKAPVVEINTSPLPHSRLVDPGWRHFLYLLALLLTCKFFSKHAPFLNQERLLIILLGSLCQPGFAPAQRACRG